MLRLLSSISVALLLLLASAGLAVLAGEPRHFPAGTLDPSSAQSDSFRNAWYSEHLRAMGEPVLDRTRKSSVYRFTWLRTFHHPVAIRVASDAGRFKLVATELDGAGGYVPGKVLRRQEIELSPTQFNEVEALVRKSGFWELPAHEDTFGLDGSEWIIEGVSGDEYHVVARWTPSSGPTREIGERLLSLAGWRFPSEETY